MDWRAALSAAFNGPGQAGDRVTIIAGGVVHGMRYNGTEENGVNDVAEFDKQTPITVIATSKTVSTCSVLSGCRSKCADVVEGINSVSDSDLSVIIDRWHERAESRLAWIGRYTPMNRMFAVLAAIAISACGSSAEVNTIGSNHVGESLVPDDAQSSRVESDEISDIDPGEPVDQAAGPAGSRRAAESCSVASRTLETAIEAHYAENRDDITAYEELVNGGYLKELDPDFFVDFTADIPTPTPVPDGQCDFDFNSEFDAVQDAERAEWEDRQCWLEQIALEVGVRGYTAEVGAAPSSFADIIGVYAEFSDSWSTVELGPNGEVVDLIPGGCDINGNLEVFGEMWIDAPPECAVDAWTLTWALHLTNRLGDDSASIEQLVAAGLIVQRPYLYQITGGSIANKEDSGCPFMEPSADDPGEEQAKACAVELRVLETAAEAFYANFLQQPASIEELVEAEYLSDVPDAWELKATGEVGSILFEPASGGRCDLAE